jgi:hypothetical protein
LEAADELTVPAHPCTHSRGTGTEDCAFKSNAVTFLTQTSATLNAKVNPDGQNITECDLEYGTSTSYSSSVPCATLPGSGSSPVPVSAQVPAPRP